MISKGKSISHTKASISYGWNQEKEAKIVFKNNLAGNTPKEVTEEFKIIQAMNLKCVRNTFSFVLSPTIEDGKKLTLKGLDTITKEFVADLKLEDHQAIAFVHNDKDHKHIHLYINRVDFSGKAYKDNYISKKAQKAAERVAKKLQLKTVKEVKEEKLEKFKSIRNEIKEKHEFCLKKYKPKNYKEYLDLMKQLSVTVIPVVNKSNKLQGFRYHFKNTNLKGSEVHRSLSFNKIQTQFLGSSLKKYNSINI